MSNTMTEEPVWVTMQTAIKISGLGQTLLYELMGADELASKKVRGRRLVNYNSLMSLGKKSPLPSTSKTAAQKAEGMEEARLPDLRWYQPLDGGPLVLQQLWTVVERQTSGPIEHRQLWRDVPIARGWGR